MFRRSKSAFSLAELLIVVALVGLVTSFALAGYNRAIERSQERTAIGNLLSIRAAVKIYKINSNGNIPDMANLNAINDSDNGLNLRLIDNVATYSCDDDDGGGNLNVCTATHPNGWSIHFHDSSTMLHCSAGTCPSCPAGAPGCG